MMAPMRFALLNRRQPETRAQHRELGLSGTLASVRLASQAAVAEAGPGSELCTAATAAYSITSPTPAGLSLDRQKAIAGGVWLRRGCMPSNGPPEPIIETPPHEPRREETGDRALGLRIRQQEILAELGVLALKGTPFNDLLREAVRLSAQGLEAEFCKVLEYMPAQNRLLMRAGVGWDEGLVGTATIGADLASPSGYALHTGKPVISNHLASEERFRTPDLLAAHGVRRAINVILQGDGVPYGVLEVDSRSAGEFSERDIAFLQGRQMSSAWRSNGSARNRLSKRRSSTTRCF